MPDTSKSIVLYFMKEISDLTQHIIMMMCGSSEITYSDIYKQIYDIVKSLETTLNDKLIDLSEYEFFIDYVKNIELFFMFKSEVIVRAPSGALTLKKIKDTNTTH